MTPTHLIFSLKDGKLGARAFEMPIDTHKIIEAYGLKTRIWHEDELFYRCAECCTGDRCDEGCTAKYKGGRKNCPHCKGSGSIRKIDAVNKVVDPIEQAIANGVDFKEEKDVEEMYSWATTLYQFNFELNKPYKLPEGLEIEIIKIPIIKGESGQYLISKQFAFLKQSKEQEKKTSYQVSGMDYSEPKTIPCAICGVPLGNHGTACGWENASVKCNLEMIIIDANHPGFGKNLDAWKREYFKQQEKSESQDEL